MLKTKDNSKGKSESESITFRIEKGALDELRQEAEQKLKSTNTLVNQIIKLYITWHKPAKKAGLGYFDNALVSEVMSYLNDEQIIQLTEKYCKQRLKDLVYMLNFENTFSSYMDGILTWLEVSGFRYKYNNVNNSSILVIQFDLGRNWSLFFKTHMQLVLEYFNIHDAQCEMTDNTVIIKIEK